MSDGRKNVIIEVPYSYFYPPADSPESRHIPNIRYAIPREDLKEGMEVSFPKEDTEDVLDTLMSKGALTPDERDNATVKAVVRPETPSDKPEAYVEGSKMRYVLDKKRTRWN